VEEIAREKNYSIFSIDLHFQIETQF
jgi:hypothetical protein